MTTLTDGGTVFISTWETQGISQTLLENLRRLGPRPNGFSVEDYFALDGSYQLEYVDGRLQVLPMPEAIHQALIFWLVQLLRDALPSLDPGARTQFAVFKVMLDAKRYREPDVCMMLGRNAGRRNRVFWQGCDLAIEVVSQSNADHDWIAKRSDYAAAGVPEYWVIDPEARTLTQFALPAGQSAYPDGRSFVVGDVVSCQVLPGLTVDVARMFAEAEAQAD